MNQIDKPSNALTLAERNRATVERFLAGTHSGKADDLCVVDETVSPAIVTHGFPGGANPDSHASYKAFFRAFAEAFTNMTFDDVRLAADGEHVAARFTISVDHVGPFAGAAPTGKRVCFTGMALYRMEDGLIAETWLNLDELGLLRQIGAELPIAA